MDQPAPAPGLSTLKGQIAVQEPDRIARGIARRTAEARATIPDLELRADVAADACLELTRAGGCSVTAVLVRACATALREWPRANAAYRDGHFELYSRVNIGVTIETPDSHVTPTLLDADTHSLQQIDDQLGRLRELARTGELSAPKLAGATFTLADMGHHHGVHSWSALVTPPQAAALTAGAIRTVPVVCDGAIVAGHVIGLTLACDHRILFGARAAGFLGRIAELVEGPQL